MGGELNESAGSPQAALIAEQLRHTIDLLRADLAALQARQDAMQAMSDHRLGRLETDSRDHEQRLRQVTDGVTQFKVWAGLASGGSSIAALVALIRVWMGG